MKNRIAIVTSGKSRGSNFSAIVEYFKKEKVFVDIAFIVVTEEDAPVIEKAAEYGINIFFIPYESMAVFETSLLLACNDKGVELIALAGFMKKLSSKFIRVFSKPIINVHPALLPKYGGKGMYGARVHKAVFEAGEKYSGVTIHYVNDEYDAGTIIAQEKVSIEDCISPEEIAERVLKLEHQLYAPTIFKVLQKR